MNSSDPNSTSSHLLHPKPCPILEVDTADRYKSILDCVLHPPPPVLTSHPQLNGALSAARLNPSPLAAGCGFKGGLDQLGGMDPLQGGSPGGVFQLLRGGGQLAQQLAAQSEQQVAEQLLRLRQQQQQMSQLALARALLLPAVGGSDLHGDGGRNLASQLLQQQQQQTAALEDPERLRQLLQALAPDQLQSLLIRAGLATHLPSSTVSQSQSEGITSQPFRFSASDDGHYRSASAPDPTRSCGGSPATSGVTDPMSLKAVHSSPRVLPSSSGGFLTPLEQADQTEVWAPVGAATSQPLRSALGPLDVGDSHHRGGLSSSEQGMAHWGAALQAGGSVPAGRSTGNPLLVLPGSPDISEAHHVAAAASTSCGLPLGSVSSSPLSIPPPSSTVDLTVSSPSSPPPSTLWSPPTGLPDHDSWLHMLQTLGSEAAAGITPFVVGEEEEREKNSLLAQMQSKVPSKRHPPEPLGDPPPRAISIPQPPAASCFPAASWPPPAPLFKGFTPPSPTSNLMYPPTPNSTPPFETPRGGAGSSQEGLTRSKSWSEFSPTATGSSTPRGDFGNHAWMSTSAPSSNLLMSPPAARNKRPPDSGGEVSAPFRPPPAPPAGGGDRNSNRFAAAKRRRAEREALRRQQSLPPNFSQASSARELGLEPKVSPVMPPQLTKTGRAKRGRATDPHSFAERVRRERIAERMLELQNLVPHANKSDKVSQLDEIIEYVRFLQMQVSTLSMTCSPDDGTPLSAAAREAQEQQTRIVEGLLSQRNLCLLPVAAAAKAVIKGAEQAASGDTTSTGPKEDEVTEMQGVSHEGSAFFSSTGFHLGDPWARAGGGGNSSTATLLQRVPGP